MDTLAQLQDAVTSLEGKTSVHAGNSNEAGLWKRFAEAMEQGAGVSNTRNATVEGYMERAALAAEAKFGGSGAEENRTHEGLLKRINDAMTLNAGAGTGSLANRIRTRAAAITFGPVVAPANTVAPAVTGTPTQGQTLTTTNGTWTGSPSPTYTYQWQAGGVNIGGATASTFLLTATQIGAAIRCVVTATNTGGAVSANSNATAAVAAWDDVPAAFTFTDVTDADLSTQYTSNTITVSGMDSGASAAVTVSGATYSKNGGAYTSSAGTAVNGDTFTVRHTSSASNSTAISTTLTIGGVSDTFTTTTVALGALTAPDINATGTAGTNPQVDIGLKSDHYANDFLDVQRSASNTFAVLTMDITYQITMEDLVDGISNAELVTEGYTNPSGGVYYQRYRIRRGDGAVSPWVSFSGDTSAGVSATLVGAQRQFVNYGYSTATFNFTFAEAGLAVFQIFVDNQPLNATPQMDGVNLTLVTSSVNGVDGSIYLYQGAVTAGVRSLTFTYPYNLYANAAAFLVKGVNSTPVDPFSQFFTGSDATVPHVPSHGALAVPSGGVGIAALGIVSGANTDTTWINGTEAYDAGDASTPTANKHSAAIFTAAQVPSFSGQDFRKTSFVAAAWGP